MLLHSQHSISLSLNNINPTVPNNLGHSFLIFNRSHITNMGLPHGAPSTMVIEPTAGRPLLLQAYDERFLPSIYPQNAGKHIFLYDSGQYSYKGKVPFTTPQSKRYRLQTLLADWAVSIINRCLLKAGCMSRSLFEIGKRLCTERSSSCAQQAFIDELVSFISECSTLQERYMPFEIFTPFSQPSKCRSDGKSDIRLDRFHFLSINNCLEHTSKAWGDRISRNEKEMLFLLSDEHCAEYRKLWRPLLEAVYGTPITKMTLHPSVVKYRESDISHALVDLRTNGDYSDILVYYVENQVDGHKNGKFQGMPSDEREEVLRRFRQAEVRYAWQRGVQIVRGRRGRSASPITRFYQGWNYLRARSPLAAGRRMSAPPIGRGRHRAWLRNPGRILEFI
jgi:hypothetical protein